MYLFYNFCTTPHVSNDHFVHHQEFTICCVCSSVQTMKTCLTAQSYSWNCWNQQFQQSDQFYSWNCWNQQFQQSNCSVLQLELLVPAVPTVRPSSLHGLYRAADYSKSWTPNDEWNDRSKHVELYKNCRINTRKCVLLLYLYNNSFLIFAIFISF